MIRFFNISDGVMYLSGIIVGFIIVESGLYGM